MCLTAGLSGGSIRWCSDPTPRRSDQAPPGSSILLSRRTLLRRSGLVAGGVGATALLAACSAAGAPAWTFPPAGGHRGRAPGIHQPARRRRPRGSARPLRRPRQPWPEMASPAPSALRRPRRRRPPGTRSEPGRLCGAAAVSRGTQHADRVRPHLERWAGRDDPDRRQSGDGLCVDELQPPGPGARAAASPRATRSASRSRTRGSWRTRSTFMPRRPRGAGTTRRSRRAPRSASTGRPSTRASSCTTAAQSPS